MLALGHGISPILQCFAGGYPTFKLDTALTTFTAKMAKRPAPGPFAAAPIVQARFAQPSLPDLVQFSRGSQINGDFYSSIDVNQGSIVFWWTPEKSQDDDQTLQETLISFDANFYLRYESNEGRLRLRVGDYSYYTSHTSTSGTTYCIAARWDCNNTLDGTNYLSISVNDSQTFGASSQPSPPTLDANGHVGSFSHDSNRGANAMIEGVTVYRRPLFDGTYGIDVGNGDEINLIYNAGSGQDPTLVTGSWDVVFCLPTNSAVGEISTGTGQAWSHPHSSNALTDGYCFTSYGSSGWSTQGTPSSGPADLAAGEKIFAGGYKWSCDSADEGITQTLSGLSAGQNYVLRLLAHCTSANAIRVRIWDETNGAQIGADFDFGASSGRAAPGVALLCFELPTAARNGVASDCTSISIKILGVASTQEVFCHQVELLENLVDNPSLETGSGTPWIPNGWTNNGLDSGTPDDSEAEASVLHSGVGCIELNSGATLSDGMTISLGSGSLDNFIAVGAWIYGDGVVGLGLGGVNLGKMVLQDGSGSYYRSNQGASASWSHIPMVMRHATSGEIFASLVGANGASGDRFADDVYAFILDDVSLTVTPASEADSTEGSDLRIDGLDTLTQPQSIIGSQWVIEWKWMQRHGAADVAKFGELTPYILDAYEDAGSYCRVYWSAANQITVALNNAGAGEQTQTWDASGAIDAGTAYTGKLTSNGSSLVFAVDGATKATIASAPPDVDALDLSWGSDNAGAHQLDAAFGNP